MAFLGSMFGGAGAGSQAALASGAAQGMPAPPPKPGLMQNIGNPSWWGAMMDSEAGQRLPMGLMLGGQQMQEQVQPPQMQAPQMPAQNPALIQMAMEMMRQQSMGAGGLPGSMPQVTGGRRMR